MFTSLKRMNRDVSNSILLFLLNMNSAHSIRARAHTCCVGCDHWLTDEVAAIAHTVNSYIWPAANTSVLHSLWIYWKHERKKTKCDIIRRWREHAPLFHARLLFNILWLFRLSFGCFNTLAYTHTHAHTAHTPESICNYLLLLLSMVMRARIL